MEGLANRFLPSAGESLFSGLWKLTLLVGGLSRDCDCTLRGSVWGWLWLQALTQPLDQPLEWALEQFLDWFQDWFLGRLPDQVPRSTSALTADS